MQLRHISTVHQPSGTPAPDLGRFPHRIACLAWSANNLRLAVGTAERSIMLYDEDGIFKEKLPTKPADPNGPKSYSLRGLEFSPDSTKLAVAQSDNIVFVYKLGKTWGEKKTICNKFPNESAVTAMTWPHQRHNELVFGGQDGKVRCGNLKSNKFSVLYQTNSYVVSMCSSPDGTSFLSGHGDGTIYRYTFSSDDRPQQVVKLYTCKFVPYALGWGQHILAAGNSSQVISISTQGQQIQEFDYSSDPATKEFTCASVNPAGHTIVLGNFDRFYVYVYNASKDCWEEAAITTVSNLLTVTALRWKSDGSRLVTGSLGGYVDTYDACIRRYTYKGEWEFTYTSLSSVIIKRLSSGSRHPLNSRFQCEITKINIYADRFVVAHTSDTLMMMDTQRNLVSEVRWNFYGGANEKFYFDNENACMIYKQGELTLVEYGKNEILGECRTEYMSPFLISLRLNEGRTSREEPIKVIAYLLDMQSIRIQDLSRSVALANINHDCKIDWLELNQRGTKLLFRDKRRALHLYDVVSQTRVTLLTVCNYVQWVPDSDVVVAQSRHQLCVWYSIHNPSDKTIINIKGDVEQIERAPGRTDVIVDEGIHRATYPLDEALIAFGAAIDAHDYQRAVATLEALPAKSKGAEAMWTHLGKLALEEGGFVIAERCFSALGDVGKTKYLNKINHIIAANGGNKDHYMVKAHIYMLNKEVKRAEACLLQYGNVDEVILMYRQLHKWDEALRVAESKNHPHVAQLRAEYYTYLLATKQEEIAGELKEKQGDYADALQLYLRGGFPARAADLVLSQNITQDTALCERVASALLANKNYEKAGEFLENIKLYDRALKAYQKGHAYHKAVELCRHAFPAQVVGLEEAWGDYLASTKQMDAACNHYIQAGAYLKAINAAIDARQGTKAAQILDQLEPGTAKPFFRRVAMYFSETNKLTEAEKYFLAGGFPQDAVAMYTSVGAWDKAHSIASTYMPPEEVSTLYVTQAQKQEAAGKWKDAERLYIAVQEPDLAISMYKKNRQYDEMIRLVTTYRKELLNETHALLARQFETEGNFKQAEQHYIKSKDWSPAVRMYKENEMWEDVLRVAKTHGDMDAYKFWAFEVARGVGGDAGTKLLVKYGVAEFAVDYAIEKLDFGTAMSIADKACKHKIQDVHYHLAMALEDEGKFAKAEDEFIKSKKPKEAIEMYIHQRAWDDAIRVAETHDPTLLPEISEAQGKLKYEEKNYVAAEGYFIAAKKPEMAIKMYQDIGSWDDAIRVAKTHAPRLVQHIQSDRMQALSTTDVANTGDFLVQQAKMLVQSKQYSAAIDAYLKLNKTHTPNLDELQRIYETALSLAIEYVRPRAIEVAQIVSKKLTEMNRWEAAADVLVHVDSFQAAIDLCIQAKLYDKAKQIAMNEAPQLRAYVDKAYQEHLVGSNKLNVLGDVNPDMAIDMYQARGEWNKVYELAAKQGDAAIQRYSAMHVQSCIKDEKYKQALQVLLKYGTPIIEANFQLYKRVAQEILAGSDRSERTGTTKNSSSNETLLELREMLFKLVHELSEIDPHSQYTAEFERLLFIAHLCALRYTCLSMDLRPLAAKIAISLLRYTTEVPVDKAFYDAGLACKEQGWLNNAFVFWNRFVDLTDLMANPDSGDIDNTDFLATDIPSPLHVPLPKEQSLSEDVREEVREWVLDQAMAETGQQLTLKHCDKCSKETYEASLNCHHCHHQYQPCIVTGFPIRAGGRVQCRSCKKDANKDDWNKYVVRMKTCPWCGTLQNPAY